MHWEVGDCALGGTLGGWRLNWEVGRLWTVHWEAGDCALGGWELCIRRLGTVHWEAGNCALGD